MVVAAEIIHAPLHCNLGDQHRGLVAVIGNMDGVHRGHQALVKETLAHAKAQGCEAAAIVFDPHPRYVFQPDAPPFLLTDLHTKCELLGGLGLSRVLVLPFVEDLYRQTPEEFVHITLAQRLGVNGIVTGADFHFGAGRTGNVEALGKLAAAAGLTAHAVTPVMLSDDEKYSSSFVRDALRQGDIDHATAQLGRPWSIRGPVIEGRQLARTLDFPTANIPLGDYLRPKFGVYVIAAETPFGRLPGIANIGTRPTVDGTHEVLEAHLFDFDQDLYGATIDVHLLAFLRSEQKFDGLPALKEQIANDSELARQWHGANRT